MSNLLEKMSNQSGILVTTGLMRDIETVREEFVMLKTTGMKTLFAGISLNKKRRKYLNLVKICAYSYYQLVSNE